MKGILCRLTVGLVTAGCITVPVSAQAPDGVVREPQQCRSCRIVLERETTLGADSGPNVVTSTFFVKRDSRGRLYSVFQFEPSAIVVFASDGAFLQKIGHEGAGPGEFRYILGLHVADGDTLHLFDVGNQRRTVLSPEYEVVRSHRIPPALMPDAYAFLPDGALVVNALVPTPAGAGYPLHLLTAEGDVERSFGTDDTYITPRTEYTHTVRRVAPGDSGVWAVPWTRYVLQLWSRDGTMRRQWRRSVPWFEPYEQIEPLSEEGPPAPMVAGLSVDAHGYLWVAVTVADSRWRSNLRRETGPDGPQVFPKAVERVYDTILEMIDPGTGRLIVSERLDQKISGFVDANRVFGFRLTPDGGERLDIWRLRLVSTVMH